ncbi:MAG: hypothetical protein ABSA77_00430 [Thermoguttaceae bacterium]
MTTSLEGHGMAVSMPVVQYPLSGSVDIASIVAAHCEVAQWRCVAGGKCAAHLCGPCLTFSTPVIGTSKGTVSCGLGGPGTGVKKTCRVVPLQIRPAHNLTFSIHQTQSPGAMTLPR